MPDGFEFDFADLNKLAADIAHVADVIDIRKPLEVTARNTRDDWRDNARGMAHAPAFPSSITYDIKGNKRSAIDAEIGPDKSRPQGALGNLIEYGSANNPAQGLGHGALQRNQEDFVTGLGKAEEDARKKGNL